jgi:hypothetical protein
MQLMKAPITTKEAKAAGYVEMTDPYFPGEEWMLESVLHDLRRGDIDHVVLMVAPAKDNNWQMHGEGPFPQVWRKPAVPISKSKKVTK